MPGAIAPCAAPSLPVQPRHIGRPGPDQNYNLDLAKKRQDEMGSRSDGWFYCAF
jgi:hypothetical protein